MARQLKFKFLIWLVIFLVMESIIYIIIQPKLYYFELITINIEPPGFGDPSCAGLVIIISPDNNMQVIHRRTILPPNWDDFSKNPKWHSHSAEEESYFITLSNSQMEYLRRASKKIIRSNRTLTNSPAFDVWNFDLRIDDYRYSSNIIALKKEGKSLLHDEFIKQIVEWSGIEFLL